MDQISDGTTKLPDYPNFTSVKKRISPEAALPKIRQFCAYRERCHSEVRDKLYTMGLYPGEVESTISLLIEQGFLDESRYASLFAGGHFRQKNWGKIKIRAALRLKKVSEANIRTALLEIDTEEYNRTAGRLAAAKITLLGDINPLAKQAKTLAYLLQKGFELAVAQAAVQKILYKTAK